MLKRRGLFLPQAPAIVSPVSLGLVAPERPRVRVPLRSWRQQGRVSRRAAFAGFGAALAYAARPGTAHADPFNPWFYGGGFDTRTDLNAILQDAWAGAYVAQLDPKRTYEINSPIVLNTTANLIGPFGFDGNGCKIQSNLVAGQDVITIQIDPSAVGVVQEFMYLNNFSFTGSGSEGNGLVITHATNNSWISNYYLGNCSFRGFGAAGCLVKGSVFEFLHFNTFYNSNQGTDGSFVMDNGGGGGIVSAMHMVGGGARDNAHDGVGMINFGCNDLHVESCYFVGNNGAGISGSNGVQNVQNCGFEQNQDFGIWGGNFVNVEGSTFSTDGKQQYGARTVGVNRFSRLSMVNCVYNYYGAGDPNGGLASMTNEGTIYLNSLDEAFWDVDDTIWVDRWGPTFADPRTVTGTTDTITPEDQAVYYNLTAGCTVTLPNAVFQPGRVIELHQVTAFALTSASSNVVPSNGTSPGTGIAAAGIGTTRLKSNGTNWVVT